MSKSVDTFDGIDPKVSSFSGRALSLRKDTDLSNTFTDIPEGLSVASQKETTLKLTPSSDRPILKISLSLNPNIPRAWSLASRKDSRVELASSSDTSIPKTSLSVDRLDFLNKDESKNMAMIGLERKGTAATDTSDDYYTDRSYSTMNHSQAFTADTRRQMEVVDTVTSLLDAALEVQLMKSNKNGWVDKIITQNFWDDYFHTWPDGRSNNGLLPEDSGQIMDTNSSDDEDKIRENNVSLDYTLFSHSFNIRIGKIQEK